ncbi:MAG: transglycosylase domain-containing protein [Flavobacteriaceae bacterium]
MNRSVEPRLPEPRRKSGELRVSAADRPGGAPGGEKPVRPQKPKPRKEPRGGRGRGRSKGGNGGGRRGIVRRVFYWGVVACVWMAIGLAGVVGWALLNLPGDTELAIPKRPPNIRIVAMDGSLVGNRGETGGEEVRLYELPPYLPQAVMAIEDRRFYSHFGVDPLGLARAVLVNFTSGDVVQGGSTLTQQLAKNLFLNPERTYKRKLQELGLALWLEFHYSKDEIMEMYLNRVYLGAGAYGVEAAAQRYFGKSARQVTLGEAAMLAGLLKAPSRYAPNKNPELAEERARTVIAAMVDAGFITSREAELARLDASGSADDGLGSSMNYVADMVAKEVEQYIGKVKGDIVVDTTIDPSLQRDAEKALRAALAENGKKRKIGQGAVVVMDPYGAVRALVGGRNYRGSEFNRAVDAHRQPGSSFKPFVYLTAMEQGLSPMDVRVDEPVNIGGYRPENYENEYKGPVTLTQGLSHSINTVAVRLADEVGPKNVIATAKRLGIRSPIEPNLSIALGTSEVSLLELTSAYVPLSNGGYGIVPHVIRRIRSVEGDILYERNGTGPGQVISHEAVARMNYMLQKTVTEGTGTRARIEGHPAAGKTGTTQGYKDAWFIGYTASYTAGVWVGNDDATPMNRVTGGAVPAEIWHDVMVAAHEGIPAIDLPGGYVPEAPDRPLIASDQMPWARQDHPVADAAGSAVKQVGRGIGNFFGRIFGR